MEPGQYGALDERLRRLEGEAAALRAQLNALATAAQPVAAQHPPFAAQAAPAPRPMPAPAMSTLSPGAAAAAPSSVEGFFAGRGLQVAGMFLVLLGVAFFLNLAFTRGWIGPAERIVLGLVAGAALVAEGARRHKPAPFAFAETLVGLGAGILYLSLWAAVAVFPQLHVSRLAAFVAMIAVTAVLAIVASTRRSERIGMMGLVGGLLTPLLLQSGHPDHALLAGYVLVLGAGFAALGIAARFRFVEAGAFVGSMLYLAAFFPDPPGWSTTNAAVVFAAIFALFTIALTAGTARNGGVASFRAVLLGLNGLCYACTLAVTLNGHETQLGVAYLALSAAMLVCALLLAARPVPMRALTATYAYLCVGAATLALPALLHRYALLDVFAIEGGLLLAIGARRNDAVAKVTGGLIMLGTALTLFVLGIVDDPANTAFSSLALSFAITVGALGAAAHQLAGAARRTADDGSTGVLAAFVTVSANVIAVAGLTRVVLDAFGGPHWNLAVPSHAQVGVSLAWTVYAAALFAIGVVRSVALFRTLGLVLFGIAIFKVLLVDLGNVDIAWRVVSAIVLGVVCIAASAWYMRTQRSPRRADA